jgi:trehalose-6-phosphate synthase
VNPFDIEAVAEAIHEAVLMDPEERRSRMHPLRECIRQENIYRWVESFVGAAETARIESVASGASAHRH